VPRLADLRNLQIAAIVATVILGALVVRGEPPVWLVAVTLAVYVVALVLTMKERPYDHPARWAKPAASDADPIEHELIEGLDQGVIVCSASGVVALANAAAKQMFKAPDLVGMNLRHVALSENLIDLMESAFKSQIVAPITREFSVDYPEPRVLRVRALRLDNKVALWIADVSDIRRLETVRRDFVGNVSHELRTPMASIRVMAETIEDDPGITIEERSQYLDKIIAEVDRLTLLSEDLLTLAAAETKPAEQSEVDLAEIARYAVQQMEGHAVAKNLTLEIDAPLTQPALGDRPQLIQVAVNLLQNAIRYTNIGGAKVRVYEEGHEAVLEVSDTGIGIGREHLPRIFERFYRVDAARSRATGGTGLGLAIVRHITEGLGGRVEVESELGNGSTFKVRLPL
jgi:two-component system phosphate regulon sensor histidine kinase PhoR